MNVNLNVAISGTASVSGAVARVPQATSGSVLRPLTPTRNPNPLFRGPSSVVSGRTQKRQNSHVQQANDRQVVRGPEPQEIAPTCIKLHPVAEKNKKSYFRKTISAASVCSVFKSAAPGSSATATLTRLFAVVRGCSRLFVVPRPPGGTAPKPRP